MYAGEMAVVGFFHAWLPNQLWLPGLQEKWNILNIYIFS